MSVYYNEIDRKAVAWLRELMTRGVIAQGDIDDRSIEDVRPDELFGYTQCHFFAGIGVWSYALRSAEWPDDRPVWTGSCPCQPFSSAGKRNGFADERHLWPAWYHLISQCRPVAVFGEQVASKDGLAWFDNVQADMEGAGYTIGANDLCAAGFGAPHIRQRLYFVADATGIRRFKWGDTEATAVQRECPERAGQHEEYRQAWKLPGRPEGLRRIGNLDYPSGSRCEGDGLPEIPGGRHKAGTVDGVAGPGATNSLDNAISYGRGTVRDHNREHDREQSGAAIGAIILDDTKSSRRGIFNTKNDGPTDAPLNTFTNAGDSANYGRGQKPGPTNGFWAAADWIPCRDGKARPVEPGTFPLAYGAAERVGRLRGYGNAIVAPVAIEFIKAYMELA